MYQTSATLQLRSALTPMRLLRLVTVDAADCHVTQTAPPDLPPHSPPAGDLHRGPPERPLRPGVKSPFPRQRRAQPRPHSGVPPTESFRESAGASLTKQRVGVFHFYTFRPRFQVCSALIHPFSSDTVPSDSEICLTFTSNQVKMHLRSQTESEHSCVHAFHASSSDQQGGARADTRQQKRDAPRLRTSSVGLLALGSARAQS